MLSKDERILKFLMDRRDYWQTLHDKAKTDDFFNVGNYAVLISELNYLIRMSSIV